MNTAAPDYVEASGVNHFATFLELTGAEGYVVHLSNEKALKEAMKSTASRSKTWS